MKKILTLVLVLSVALLSSCTVYVENVEGEVPEVKDEVPQNIEVHEEIAQTEAEIRENEEAEEIEEEAEEAEEAEKTNNYTADIDALINSVGGIKCENGETYEAALEICTALIEKDYNKLSEFTMGIPEYYSFLDEIEFSGFEIFPFAFTEEKKQSILDSGKYPVYGETYLAVFGVDSGENEYFKNGENLFYLSVYYGGYYEMEVTFAPFEQIEELISEGSEYVEYFIDEFISLNSSMINDGTNLAESFDFSDNPHLITHLMVKSGLYNMNPPFSLDEINDYIARAFAKNKGISLESAELRWKHSLYESDDPNQKYGCSYAHGGSATELTILDVRRDGGNMEVDVQIYCDFAHFAKAVKLTFVFSNADDVIPQLDCIVKYDNTARRIAGTSY